MRASAYRQLRGVAMVGLVGGALGRAAGRAARSRTRRNTRRRRLDRRRARDRRRGRARGVGERARRVGPAAGAADHGGDRRRAGRRGRCSTSSPGRSPRPRRCWARSRSGRSSCARSRSSACSLALAIPVVGLLGIGGTSIEAAERRSGLVGALRFAATIQDLRTVIVLHRQLAQERSRPNAVVPAPARQAARARVLAAGLAGRPALAARRGSGGSPRSARSPGCARTAPGAAPRR